MRQNSIRGELSLLLAIMSILGVIILSTPVVRAEPESWWDLDWSYRIPMTLNIGENVPFKNYQYRIVLDNTDNLGGHIAFENFQDLRFLENENTGVLNYWIENYVSGDNCIVWVCREENSLIDNTIFVYYSNPSAGSVSSLTNTFDLFEQAVVGVPLSPCYGGAKERFGQRITLENQRVWRTQFHGYKYNGSPWGDITNTVRKVSDDSVIQSENWGDASEIPYTNPTKGWFHPVDFASPPVINEEVRIMSEFYGGDANNAIGLTREVSDVITGVETYYEGSYYDESSRDATIRIYTSKTVFPEPTASVETEEQVPPNEPISLLCEGSTNPTRVIDLMPEFSAIGTDPQGDQMDYYALQVDNDSGFGSPIWNQTKTSITAFDNGAKCEDITYVGSTLSRGTTYYWRIKFWDNNGYEGNWSTETATFKINQLPITSNLKTEGLTNPIRVTTLTPTFSWTYSDPDEDNQSHWQIWVGTTSGTNDKWNSGEISGTDNSDVYDGSALSRGITYYVQVRTKDNFEWSDWATGTFRINQLPTQTYSEQTFYEDYTPTLIWGFSDPDGDSQLGVKVQVDNDPGFGSLLWDHSDNTTTAQSKVYAGDPLEKNVTYYARVQVRDGYEWSGTWSDNTFTILPIPSLIVAEVTVDSITVDRKAHWAGDGDVKILVTAKDNEGRDAIENAYFWIRDNNDIVVVDNVIHTGYENGADENTKKFWFDYNPSDVLLDNALGEFDVKVQAVSVNFENTKDYTDLGFKLFTVNDHSITFSPVREIYAEGEIITFEPVVKSVASGSAIENAYLKLELISELGEVLRTVGGYTNGSGKLATHTTLLEADIGFYDIRISTSKGAIDGQKLYEDAFTVAAELLVSVESITPADDSVSGLLRSRSIVPEDVIVKVLVFDTAGTELLNLTSDSMRVENAAPQLEPWQVSYGMTLAEGTYSYRVEVWESDLGTLHHVAFAEVRLAVAPSQQAVGDWLSSDTIALGDDKFDVVLRRESIVTNPETVDKSNFLFKESIPAPQGSTVMVRVSGLPTTTLSVDQYGMITKYFDVRASTTVKIEMEVTIACAVKIEALEETEIVVAAVPKTVVEHKFKVTNLTSTTLRQLELTFPVSGVVAVMDEDGVPIVKFWEAGSTVVEIPVLGPYQEITLTLTAEKAPSLPDMLEGLITWTIYGFPIILPLLGLGAVLAVLTRKKTEVAGKIILLLLPLIVFLGLWLLGVI